MENLNIENFELATNLITKVNQATYDMIGHNENDYFDVTIPENDDNAFVISFFKDCELQKVYVANKDNLEKVINEGISKVWKI